MAPANFVLSASCEFLSPTLFRPGDTAGSWEPGLQANTVGKKALNMSKQEASASVK